MMVMLREKLELCVHDNMTQTQNSVITEIQTVCKNINKAKVIILLKRTTKWRKFMKIIREFLSYQTAPPLQMSCGKHNECLVQG